MKILILDEEFPFPLNSGKRIRSFNLAHRLALQHEVHYLAYGESGSDSYRALADGGMNPIPVPIRLPSKSGPMFYLRLLENLFSQYPYIVSSHYSREFERIMYQAIGSFQPDIIICEWSPYAAYVLPLEGIRRLIVAHNLESRIWQRYYENEKQLFKKWYIGVQFKKVTRFEQLAFGRVEAATAVSEVEAGDLRGINPQLMVQVIENGVDLRYFTPSDNEPQGSRLVFIGSMNWRPNQDAIHYFVAEILPFLKSKNPNVEVDFVGQDPPSHILRLNSLPGVRIVGKVDDVRPFVREAQIYIVPLRIGGGTRLKILEAMAMGKAIVSTSIGAEGLAVADGVNILLADTPEQFSSKISQLLDDKIMRQRLGISGRKLVEDLYGWDLLGDKLQRFLNEVIGAK